MNQNNGRSFNKTVLVQCPLCPGLLMVVRQGKSTINGLCPSGCRVFGLPGDTLAMFVENMPHEIMKVRGNEVVIMGSAQELEKEKVPANYQQNALWR